jgi:hypothetical protein
LVVAALALTLVAYGLVAYFVMPTWWKYYARRHPALDATPGITVTSDDHPGDPINIALVGTQDELRTSMSAAKWIVADPLGLKSDMKIAAATVLEHPYAAAPVSDLFLWGRREDIAFEQPFGNDPRRRHHVRFWKSRQLDEQGRPLWVGSISFDRRVGLSHTTGQVTHHISGDVDAERDRLFDELKKSGGIVNMQIVEGFHKVLSGRNGGGDAWHTDGRLLIGWLRSNLRS